MGHTLYTNLNLLSNYIFLGWNVLVFLLALILFSIYRKLHYIYLFAFELFLFIFFLEHQSNYELSVFFLFLDGKIKLLFLLFSGYMYFLFALSFFREESILKNRALIGIIIFGISFSALFWNYENFYKIEILSFSGLLMLAALFSFRKGNSLQFYLWLLVSLSIIAQIGILFLIDISPFISQETTLVILHLLNFIHALLILTIVSIEARKDIQKRIQTEQNLHELEKQKLAAENRMLELEKIYLEEKSKLNFIKNEFLTQAVKSLQIPTINILNTSELLLGSNDIIQDPYLTLEVRSILENSKILLDTLQDLSDFSLLETNSITLNKNPIDLSKIIDFVIISLNDFLIGKNIQFVKQIPSDLPLIEGDEERLLQAIQNLLIHVLENSVDNFIDITASLVPGYLKVKIKYSGTLINIPHLGCSSILDWFSKESSENFQRLLNLAVTSRVIKLGGGRVYSKKDTETESSLVLFLPISDNQNKTITSQFTSKKTWAEFYIYPNFINNSFQFHTQEPDTVLVLEHERIHLQTIQGILNAYNYKSILTDNTRACLEEIHKEKPSLALVDLSTPESYKFCQLVREIYDKNELPILLIVSYSSLETVNEFFELCNDIIIKPFTKEKLIAKIRSTINLTKINQAYKRFVPPEFIGLLNKKDISELKLGDHVQKRMTILFSDLRNYTQLSESMTPEENFNFLNSYLKRIGPIVRNYRGFIDKYIGDAIMAIFPKEPEDAVRCAIEMQKAIHEFNIERTQRGEKRITAGIGIHTGDVILGTLGEEKRMEGTVISDAVNLSSRLENLTKLYKASILISMDTFLELEEQENYNFRILDRVKVKGKEQFVTVVEIMDGYEEDKLARFLECKIYFEEGVSYYLRKEFDVAMERFKKVLNTVPDDQATKIYIQRIEFYQKHGVPLNWDGVEVLDEKFS